MRAGIVRRRRPLPVPLRRHRPSPRGSVDGWAAGAGDRGTAGILVLAMVLVLLVAGSVVTGLASIAVVRQRAASAADLSALAAAGAALEGPAAACERATRLAAEVAARLVSCTLEGDVAEVVAEVRPGGAVGRFGAASARARAGPVAVPP